MRRRTDQLGETLIEVLIAIVLVGAISSAYFITYATTAKASSGAKDLVSADGVARSYAERVKDAVRSTCTSATAGNAFTVGAPPNMPSGFSVAAGAGQLVCPDPGGTVAEQLQQVDITVTTARGAKVKLSIEVRAP
jgi:prepilin-type N-terminal cleavage/methylation domain-containing protein